MSLRFAQGGQKGSPALHCTSAGVAQRRGLESIEGSFPRIAYGCCWLLLRASDLLRFVSVCGLVWASSQRAGCFQGQCPGAKKGRWKSITSCDPARKLCDIISAVFSLLKPSKTPSRFKGRGGEETNSRWGTVEFWKFMAVTMLEKTACCSLEIYLAEAGPFGILPPSFSDGSKPAETLGCNSS